MLVHDGRTLNKRKGKESSARHSKSLTAATINIIVNEAAVNCLLTNGFYIEAEVFIKGNWTASM